MLSGDVARVADVFSALGTPELGHALDKLLEYVSAFDMSSIFAFRSQTTPQVVYDGYSAGVQRDALTAYVKGGYLLDPFYVACVEGVAEGLWRMADLAPDDYFSTGFEGLDLVHPCISDEAGSLVEEIGFVCPLQDGWVAAYSLMRNRTSQAFASDEFADLSTMAPLVAAALRRHWALTASEDQRQAPDGVETALQRAFAERLTPAQYRVVQLILRGHSNVSIARQLHITEGTVKLHRHNAYQRLEISGQSELFTLFLESLGLD